MEHIIIGTAGHIDHGKTALIRALTGRETDTHKEEKERGITIDLGFTYLDLTNGMRAGIIDVPGHEKFLPNMLAGVCGMDFVMITIALDEGIMPQTREHMDILEQLNIENGILVLTKRDMVDEEWAMMMQEEIKEELKNRIFATWPMIQVSAHDGTGMAELKILLEKMANACKHQRETKGHFRLPIDRLFQLKGLGTVVAGTVLEGNLQVNQEVMLYPSMKRVKIRDIQSHGETKTEVSAGQRAALLLAGIDKSEIKRGMVIGYPESICPTNRIDVVIRLNEDCKRVIKNQSRIHLHVGTDEVIARVVLLEHSELKAGEKGFAQLIMERPICVKRNDRFVIRFLSPVETVGGGKILQILAKKHKRMDDAVLMQLSQREADDMQQLILSVIDESMKQPVSQKSLHEQVQMDIEEFKHELSLMEEEKIMLVIPGRKQNYYWSHQAADQKWNEISDFFESYHKEHPYRRGLRKSYVKSALLKGMETAAAEAYLDSLLERGFLNSQEEFLWLSGFEIVEDEVFAKTKETLLREAKKEGYALCDYEKVFEQTSFMSQEMLKDIVDALTDSGVLVHIHDTLCTTKETASEIEGLVMKYFDEQEIISFATLRDLLGVSRKAAKPLMAYLDEQKITLWCGKETERKKNPFAEKEILQRNDITI